MRNLGLIIFKKECRKNYVCFYGITFQWVMTHWIKGSIKLKPIFILNIYAF
jgi:hypothetical protein